YTGMEDRLHINANLTLQDGKVIGHTKVLYPTIVNNVYAKSPNCAGGGQYYSAACWADVLAVAQDISGNTPPGLAKVAGSFDISYDFNVPGGTLTPWIQYLHEGVRQARIFNEPVLDREPAYNLLNLSLTYQPARSNFRFNLAVSNATDKAAVNSRYTSPYEQGLTSQQFVAPRQIIGSIGYKF
ncbi:MAG TPA: hypothetical protein VGC28_05445, partial [Sphingomonas sp.]